MKSLVSATIAVCAALSASACAPQDQVLTETKPGSYRAVADCGYDRLSRRYQGLRRESFEPIGLEEIHYDKLNADKGHVAFADAAPRRTRVEYRANRPGRDETWNVLQLRADLAGCGSRRRR